MSSHVLFRNEAVEAVKGTWLGPVSIVRQPRSWLIVAVAGFITSSLLVFVFFGTYTRNVSARGILVTTLGTADITVPEPSIIQKVLVSDGEAVHSGQTLAVLTRPHVLEDGTNLSRETESQYEIQRSALDGSFAAKAKALDKKHGSLLEEERLLGENLKRLRAEQKVKEDQLLIAKDALAKYSQIEHTGYISQIQLSQQKSGVLQSEIEVSTAHRLISDLERQSKNIEAQLHGLPEEEFDLREIHKRDLSALLVQQIEGKSNFGNRLVAPVDGVITNLIAKEGQSVDAKTVIAQVLPGDGRVEGRLSLPSGDVGFLQLGDSVSLRFDAYPYQKFGRYRGRIASIGQNNVPGGAAQADPDYTNASPVYRITVALLQQHVTAYGNNIPLRPGMAFVANIHGDRRRIVDLILDPLYSFTGG